MKTQCSLKPKTSVLSASTSFSAMLAMCSILFLHISLELFFMLFASYYSLIIPGIIFSGLIINTYIEFIKPDL